MARTPLLRSLRRAARLARFALHTGRDAAEVVAGRREAPGWSRRELLTTSAVVAAGLAAGCTSWGRDRRPVLVVGAGIAGLTCAYRLMKKRVPVRVIEGQERVGGRMYSLTGGFPENQVCELGGELIDSNHETMHRLCRELELPLDDFDQDTSGLTEDLWWFEGRAIPEAEVVAAFVPVAAKMAAAWEEVTGDSFDYHHPNGAERIDRLTLGQWLDEAGCHGWFRRLLEVAYVTEFGLEVDQQSPWNLLTLIDYETPDPFRIFGDSDERFHVRGGNDQVPTRLAERLGARVETGVRLEAVKAATDGGYLCTVNRGGSVETIAADHVVLSLPFTKLREVQLDVELPAVKKRAIDELGYGTNAKLMVGFSERVWRTVGRSSGSVLADLPFQLTWESTRLQAGTGGILVCYTGGDRGVAIGQGTPAEQAVAFTRELEKVFPGVAAQRTTEVRFHWPSFPWALGSYACYRPGQWTSIGGAEGERVGNLHFCGEHTSADFQGFMEGGAESGERAAREVLGRG